MINNRFNNLFSKIMGSYIVIPILILVTLLIFLPRYLEEYFFRAKERELLKKGEIVRELIVEDFVDTNSFLRGFDRLLDVKLLIINKDGEIIHYGRRANGGASLGRRRMNPHKMEDLQDKLKQVLAGGTVFIKGEAPILDYPIMGVGIPLELKKEERVALFLLSPLKGLKETVVKVRDLTMRVILGALFLALLLGYFISKGISNPVQEMKKKAQRMADGDFSVELDNLPNDEIGDLGESFNHLAAKLEENINELATEKKRMQEMLTSMAEGVLGVAKSGEIILANPRFEEILMIEGEVIGSNYVIFGIDDLAQAVTEVLREQEDVKVEFEYQEKIIVAQAAPINKNDEELWGVIILLSDVTGIRRLDQMRRLFVANASHELKTPLTAIRGYLEAVLDGVVDDIQMQEEYLKRVLSETNRMTRLVGDILNLSRLQSGQFEFNLVEIDLITLINSILKNLEGKLGKREVEVNLLQELNFVTDKDKLEEVIINLVDNAIKFTAETGQIEIGVEPKENKLLFWVEDDGIGISDSELTYVWERFHQVDRAREPDKEGTGLGLAIVKEIVEGLGGSVAVESRVGRGSKFSFTLPRIIEK